MEVKVFCPRCYQSHGVEEQRARAMDYTILCNTCKRIEQEWESQRETQRQEWFVWLSNLFLDIPTEATE